MLPASQIDAMKLYVSHSERAGQHTVTLSCEVTDCQVMTSTEGTHTLDLIQPYQAKL